MIRFIIIIALFLPFASDAQKLTIKGTVTGMQNGTSVVLKNFQEAGEAVLKATKSKGEKFTLSVKLEEPVFAGLIVADSLKRVLFLGNNKVNISGAVTENIEDWKITGSALQTEFDEFQKNLLPRFQQLNELTQYFQMGLGNDSLKTALDNNVATINNWVDSFIAKHPASPVSAMAILSTINLTEDRTVVEKRAAALQPAAMNSALGGHLKKALIDLRFLSIGSPALDFTQKDVQGNEVSLSSFRGKYVLVDFWASWCGPCRRENHFLLKTYEKFKDKNFTVLGVSLDEDKNDWEAAIKKDE
ncbi:MAG: redoxin domain-containing protein [Niabella sp.]